jgi:hypothetical protein
MGDSTELPENDADLKNAIVNLFQFPDDSYTELKLVYTPDKQVTDDLGKWHFVVFEQGEPQGRISLKLHHTVDITEIKFFNIEDVSK